MSITLNQFLSVASPLEIMCDLGHDMIEQGDDLKAPCPGCGSTLWVLKTGFVCENKKCRFRAGSVLDYLVHWEKGYSQALDTFRVMYDHKLDIGSSPWNLTKANLLREAVSIRKVFDFFLWHGNEDVPDTIYKVQARGELRKIDIDPQACKNSIFVLDDDEMRTLSRLLLELGCTLSVAAKDAYVVLPYYSSHHTVSELVLYDTKSRTFSRTNVTASRFSYFGLLEETPGTEDLHMCISPVDAARRNSQNHGFGTETRCCALGFNPKVREFGYVPESLIYLHHDEDHLAAPAAIYKECSGLQVKQGADFQMPWSGFLVSQGRALLQEDRCLSVKVRRFLESGKFGETEKAELLDALKRTGELDLAASLETYFATSSVYRTDDISLFSGPDGYHIIRTKDGVRKDITNFSFDLKRNIHYPGSPELYHEGVMSFNGSRYPILVNSKQLESAKDFEMTARMSEARNQKPGSDHLPLVSDREGARHALTYLRSAASRLPRVEGLPHLGWDLMKTTFYGPFWKVTASGVEIGTRPFNPGLDLLKFFSCKEIKLSKITNEITSGARDLLAQIIAMTLRGYFGYPVHPIQIQHNQESRYVLDHVFGALGQIQPVELNFNSRTHEELPGLNGFPVYGVGYTKGQVLKSKAPMFVLGEEGLTMSRGEDDLGPVLRGLMYACLQWVIRTQGRDYVRHQSVNYGTEILKEGANAITMATGMEWDVDINRYTKLENVLKGIPEDRVSEYFSHDMEAQRMYFFYKKVPDLNVTDLELELKGVTEVLEVQESRIVMDALSATQILSNYYQKLPSISLHNLQGVLDKMGGGAADAT